MLLDFLERGHRVIYPLLPGAKDRFIQPDGLTLTGVLGFRQQSIPSASSAAHSTSCSTPNTGAVMGVGAGDDDMDIGAVDFRNHFVNVQAEEAKYVQ